MKLSKYAAVLATTTALVGASLAVPTANAFATGTVTLTAVATMVPGSRVSLPVRVAYPDGSVNSAQISAEFVGYPEGTGAVTVTAPASAVTGAGLNMGVTAAFRDGSQKQFTVTATVTEGAARDVDTYSPSYAATTTTQGESVVVKLSGEVPAGTKYALGYDVPASWDIQVNETTGDVTATPRAGAGVGTYVRFPVRITYPDGTIDYADARVEVTENAPRLSDSVDVSYADTTINAVKATTAAPQVAGVAILPEGTTFPLAGQIPSGWTIDVNETTGRVSVTPPTGSLPGASISLPTAMMYPDGSKDFAQARIKDFAQARITVAAPETPIADTVELAYADASVSAGDTVTIELGSTLPAGTKIYGPNREYARWSLSTNDSSGTITITAPADGRPGSGMNGTVQFQFADGSTKAVPFTVSIPSGSTPGGGDQEETTTPLAQSVDVSYSSTVTVEQSGSVIFGLNGAVPEGTRFSVGNDAPEGWGVQVNETTGELRVTAPADAANGANQTTGVSIVFADGLAQTKQVRFTVEGDTTPPLAETTAITYEAHTPLRLVQQR